MSTPKVLAWVSPFAIKSCINSTANYKSKANTRKAQHSISLWMCLTFRMKHQSINTHRCSVFRLSFLTDWTSNKWVNRGLYLWVVSLICLAFPRKKTGTTPYKGIWRVDNCSLTIIKSLRVMITKAFIWNPVSHSWEVNRSRMTTNRTWDWCSMK